jgi:hypothetical protein
MQGWAETQRAVALALRREGRQDADQLEPNSFYRGVSLKFVNGVVRETWRRGLLVPLPLAHLVDGGLVEVGVRFRA